MELHLGEQASSRSEVLSVSEYATKESASQMYRVEE